MELHENTFHAWYYRGFYCDTFLPQSFCKYFWKTVLAFLFLPICFPTIIICLILKNRKKQTYADNYTDFPFWAHLLIIILLFLFGAFSLPAKNPTWVDLLKAEGWGALVLIAFCLFASICSLFMTLDFKHGKSFVGEGVKSFTKKYCPKINWK